MKIAKIERVTNIAKTQTMIFLLVIFLMFFSTTLAQKDTSGWTPPQVILNYEYNSSGSYAYASYPVSYTVDLSGNWHAILLNVHVDYTPNSDCPYHADIAESLIYVNHSGETELIVSFFYTMECDSHNNYEYHGDEFPSSMFGSWNPSIVVDGSGTIHVAYLYHNYDTGEQSLKHTKRKRPKEWTFMIYMDGDNNLEHAGILDLNEMEKVGSSDSVNIVVQMDRIEGFDNSNGNWTGTKRFFVIPDTNSSIINSFEVEDLGEMNMGDPATLDSFITWAKREFPAKKYCLVLWDHGSGWQKAGRGL